MTGGPIWFSSAEVQNSGRRGGVTRIYFGGSSDLPVPGDYSCNGIRAAAVFRESAGLWAVRGVTRLYFGAAGDRPVPADFKGTGGYRVSL